MLNKVILLGNLVADPEIRNTNDGTKVCNIRLATSEKWTNRNGEKQEKSEFHRLVVWNQQGKRGLVDIAEQYLRKGSKVYIEGQLQTRKWQDQSGNDKYSTEVVLRGFDSKLIMLDGRQKGGDTGQSHQNPPVDLGVDTEIPF